MARPTGRRDRPDLDAVDPPAGARTNRANAMNLQQFLDHHGLKRNPFAEEDAQTDPVFKNHCIVDTHHPTWDKVYGDPAEPGTSIVFGEKGAGKTAIRLQIAKHVREWNRQHPEKRLAVVHYDDFNPFLDRFADRQHGRRRPDRVLAQWKLWDHLDAILALTVTGLVDRVLESQQRPERVDIEAVPRDVERLDRFQARDLLLLAACYDQSTAETYVSRWHRLRKLADFSVVFSYWDTALGIGWTVFYVLLLSMLRYYGWLTTLSPFLLHVILLLAGWGPWAWRSARTWWTARKIVANVRVSNLAVSQVYRVLKRFQTAEIASQPLPTSARSDDRYEMLEKLLGILRTWKHPGLLILVDRVDEPHLINGSPDLMRALIWPMLDNKFLKYPGIGLKLMLPIELYRFVEKEGSEFYQRARLDKQNLVSTFDWTPEALVDVANARIAACRGEGGRGGLRDWIDPAVGDRRLIEAIGSLRVPRHVFKFLYRLLVAHCHAHSAEQPSWKIGPELFETTLAIYRRDQQMLDRGLN